MIRYAFATTLLLATICAQEPVSTTVQPAARPVDLVICLDTSGSMDGLIDAARRNIWAIVNDLALAKPAPKLRVALLTYGNDGHDPERGWVAIDSPFTDDLDLISEHLFALTTNGGTELVGRVVKTAVDGLEWDPTPDALRLIVVAGNESAEQDQEVSIQDASGAAIGHGILVNSIYCGDPADQIADAWRSVATFADGQFAAIDHDNGNVVVETPFDKKLAELSAALNQTYVPYGTKWAAAQQNQVAQDENAESLDRETAALRAVCKASVNYQCAAWDLVDALRLKQVELSKVKKAELPEALRKLTTAELKAHVDAMAKQRSELQAQIAELAKQRTAFVAKEMDRRAIDGDSSFEFAVRRAVRAQAEAKGFTFRAKTKVTKAETEPAPATEAR